MARPDDHRKGEDGAATPFSREMHGTSSYGSLKRPATYPAPLDKLTHRSNGIWNFVDQGKDKVQKAHTDGYGGRTDCRATSSVASDSSFSHEEPVQKSPIRANTFESTAYQFPASAFSSGSSSPAKFSFTFNDKTSDRPVHSQPSIFSNYLNLVQQNLRHQNLEPTTNMQPFKVAATHTTPHTEPSSSSLHITPIINRTYQASPAISDITSMSRVKKNQPDQDQGLPARSSTRIAIKRSAQDAGMPSARGMSSPGLESNPKKAKNSSGGQPQPNTSEAEAAVRPTGIQTPFYEEDPELQHRFPKGLNPYFDDTKTERKPPPYQRLDSLYSDWEDDVEELRPDLVKANEDPKGDDAKLVASMKLMKRPYPLSGARNVSAEGYGEREDDYGFDARKQGLLPKKKVNYHGYHHRSKVGKKLFAAAKLPRLLTSEEQTAIIAAAATDIVSIVPAIPRIIKSTIPVAAASEDAQEESEAEGTSTASGGRRGGRTASGRPSRGSTVAAETSTAGTTHRGKKSRSSRDRAELHADEEEDALHIKRKAGHSLRAQIRRVRYLDEDEGDEDDEDSGAVSYSEQADVKEVASASEGEDSKEVAISAAGVGSGVEADQFDRNSAANAGTREGRLLKDETNGLGLFAISSLENDKPNAARIIGRRNPSVSRSAIRGQTNMRGFDAHARYRAKRLAGRQSQSRPQSPAPTGVKAGIPGRRFTTRDIDGGKTTNDSSSAFHPNTPRSDFGSSAATPAATSQHPDTLTSASGSSLSTGTTTPLPGANLPSSHSTNSSTATPHHGPLRRLHPVPRTLHPRDPPRRDPDETPSIFAGRWDAAAPPETSVPHSHQQGQRAANDTGSIMTTVQALPRMRNGWSVAVAPSPPPAETTTSSATASPSGRQLRTQPLIAPRPPPAPALSPDPDPVPRSPSTQAPQRSSTSDSASSMTPAHTRGHAVDPPDHLDHSSTAYKAQSLFSDMWPIPKALRQAGPNSLLSNPLPSPQLHPKWRERKLRYWIENAKHEIVDVIEALDTVDQVLGREGLDHRGMELWMNCLEELKAVTTHFKELKSSCEDKK